MMVGKILTVGTALTLTVVGLAATAQDTKPAATTAPAAAGGATVFGVDDVHSTALFRVMHAGAGQFWGRFNDISGTFTLSDDPAKLAFMIDVAIDSVDSGNDKLDGHLKSPDFFNSKEFPKMSFKSTGAKKAGNGMFEVMGDLTMHGVTKPITAMVEITGQSSMMGQRGGAEATFTVKRSEFGMTYGVEKGVIGDMVKVVVGLEGIVPTK
jgi:polyisoprenoid-binding protein YceI